MKFLKLKSVNENIRIVHCNSWFMLFLTSLHVFNIMLLHVILYFLSCIIGPAMLTTTCIKLHRDFGQVNHFFFINEIKIHSIIIRLLWLKTFIFYNFLAKLVYYLLENTLRIFYIFIALHQTVCYWSMINYNTLQYTNNVSIFINIKKLFSLFFFG